MLLATNCALIFHLQALNRGVKECNSPVKLLPISRIKLAGLDRGVKELD